jgi:hypothetical protein
MVVTMVFPHGTLGHKGFVAVLAAQTFADGQPNHFWIDTNLWRGG